MRASIRNARKEVRFRAADHRCVHHTDRLRRWIFHDAGPKKAAEQRPDPDADYMDDVEEEYKGTSD